MTFSESRSFGARMRALQKQTDTSPPAVTSPAGDTASPSSPQPEGEAFLSRADKYLARIDAHLPKLPGDHERRLFLDGQLMHWERAYDRFISTEGESAPGCDAADFASVLAGIGQRQLKLRRAM